MTNIPISTTRYGFNIETWRGLPEATDKGVTWFARNDGEGATSQRIGLSVESSEACGIVVRKSGFGTWVVTYHYAAYAQDINTHAGVWLRDDTTPEADSDINAPEFYSSNGDINDPTRLHVSSFLHNDLVEMVNYPLPAFVLWRSTIVYGPHDTHTRVEGLRGKDWIPVASKSFHIESNGKATPRIMIRHLAKGFSAARSDRAEAKLTVTDISFTPAVVGASGK